MLHVIPSVLLAASFQLTWLRNSHINFIKPYKFFISIYEFFEIIQEEECFVM